MNQRWVQIAIVVIILGIASGFLWWQNFNLQPTLKLVDTTFDVVILSNEKERIQGLSGTKTLPKNQAILFDFEYEDTWGIWMKDMNYAIDIIWTDSNGKVVYMVKDAQPSSYPNTVYKSSQLARYVIETISGTIDMTGLKKGDIVTLPSGK